MGDTADRDLIDSKIHNAFKDAQDVIFKRVYRIFRKLLCVE